MKDVTVVTVTYNSGEIIEEFLSCLRAQIGISWNLIIVDNDSKDRTREILAGISDPNISIIYENINTGVAAANNKAILLARPSGPEYVLLINNDVAFAPDLLMNLVRGIQVTGASAISPAITYYDRPERIWYAGGSFTKWRGILNYHDNEGKLAGTVGADPFQTDYAPTTCLMFRSSVFDRIGYLDEEFFLYWEDVDLLWRMKKSNLPVYVYPSEVLLHKVSVTSGGPQSDVAIRYSNRNQIFFARKYHGRAWAGYTAAMALLAGCARIILRGDTLHHLTLRWRAIHEGFRMPATAGIIRRAEID